LYAGGDLWETLVVTPEAGREFEQISAPPVDAPASAPAGPPRVLTSVEHVLALQRTAGNVAVTSYLARQEGGAATAAPSAIEALRELLDDGDEEGAIAKCATLLPDEATLALSDASLRAAAVDTFDDEEMSRAMIALRGGTLVQKLNWMSVEGSDLELVWPLIIAPGVPATEKTALYDREYIRDFFVGLCDNEEMATLVNSLGGTVTQKLDWMIHEGTSGDLVFPVIGMAPESELYITTPFPEWLDEGLDSELSRGDYERA
jgi:hypothetical protein